MTDKDTLVIHTRLPARLVKLLDHEAIDHSLYRAEMLAAILEERYGPSPYADAETSRLWQANILMRENPPPAE